MKFRSLRMSRLFPLVAAVTAGSFAGCASSTVIQSNPSGAKVYLDGMVAGNTPYTMTDTKIVGSSTHLRLELAGYQPHDAIVSRNEEFDPMACLGGVFLLVPFLWVMKYKPVHTYELRPLGYQGQNWGPPQSTPQATPPGGYPQQQPQPYPPQPQPYPPQPQPQPR